MNIVLLVSSPNIPFRARKLARISLGSSGEILRSETNNEVGKIIVKNILVRELPYHKLFGKKETEKNKSLTDKKESSKLIELSLQFDDEISRAKLSYVREYHTIRGMSRLSVAKADLIIDLDGEAEIHHIVAESSRMGVLRIETELINGVLISQSKLVKGAGSKENLLTRKAEAGVSQLTHKRTLLLESIVLLSSR